MKCLLNYFAMNRQSGEREREGAGCEGGRGRRVEERERKAEGVEERERERDTASTVGERVRDATVTAIIEKSPGWDSVKHWHWYGI